MSDRFIYVMCKPELAPEVSKAFWDLHRDPDIRKPGEHEYYCAWYDHPTNGYSVLEIPRDEELPVHIKAEKQKGRLKQVLKAFVRDAAIVKDDEDSMLATVEEKRGSKLKVAEMVPAGWAQHTFDSRADAAAAGFFPEEAE